MRSDPIQHFELVVTEIAESGIGCDMRDMTAGDYYAEEWGSFRHEFFEAFPDLQLGLVFDWKIGEDWNELKAREPCYWTAEDLRRAEEESERLGDLFGMHTEAEEQ